jgi:hypothetical protein
MSSTIRFQVPSGISGNYMVRTRKRTQMRRELGMHCLIGAWNKNIHTYVDIPLFIPLSTSMSSSTEAETNWTSKWAAVIVADPYSSENI